MRHILRLFFTHEGSPWWIVIACLFVSSLLEGIGLMSLVPLLSVVLGNQDSEPSELTRIAQDIFDKLGLQLEFAPLLICVIIFLILKTIFAILASRYIGYAITDLTTGLRTRIAREFFEVNWGFIIRNPFGRVATAIGGETSRVGRAYEIGAFFITEVIQAFVYLVVAFTVSWQAALLALVVGGVIAVALQFFVRMSRKAGRRSTKLLRELMVYLSDSMNNLKPLKAMGKEEAFATLLENKALAIKKETRRGIDSGLGMKGGQEILFTLAMGGGLFVAITIWNVPLVELVVVGVVLSRTLNGFNKIQNLVRKAAGQQSPYLALEQLFRETAAAREESVGPLVSGFEHECRFENVTFGYTEEAVLHSVSMNIPANSTTVLVGPSGSGKTTLIDLVIGLYRPREGQILIDGNPITGIDINSWRRQIGYVPQELVLFHDTILANISLGDETIGEKEALEALMLAGAADFIDEMPEGLMTVVGERGAKLSGGQRQRISLARALACKPKLLILDEVTSALDPNTELQICRNIQENLQGKTAILAITHRPAFLDIADQVYRVEDGVVESMPRDTQPVVA